MKNNFNEELKKYFKSTSREKVLEDWEKSNKDASVGPTLEKFLEASGEYVRGKESVTVEPERKVVYEITVDAKVIEPNDPNSPNGIVSVKYIPTGEVFKLGDKVVTPGGTVFTVNRFYTNSTGEHILCGPEHVGVRKIRHVNSFGKDENGNTIYEGSFLYQVNTRRDFNLKELKMGDMFLKVKHCKYFVNKEDAKNYIIENKPLLTLKEIEDCLYENFSLGNSDILSEDILREKAKQKL